MADEHTTATTPTAPDATTQTGDAAALAAAAAKAKAEDAAAVDRDDDALLAQMSGEPATESDADGDTENDGEADTAETKPAGKKAKPEAEAEEETDPLDGLDIPGVKSTKAAPGAPDAQRLAVARGRMELLARGLTEEDIDALPAERLASIGASALKSDPAPEVDEQVDTATTAAEAPALNTAELDALLAGTLLDKEEQAKVRDGIGKVVSTAVAAQVKAATAKQVKALQDATARAEEATSGMLKMRFHTAFKPLLTEYPQLKDKAVTAQVLAAMDKLDPKTEIAYAADDQAFTRLLRQAVFVALGDKIAGAARAAAVTKGKRQAATVPAAPVGGASAVRSQRSQSDDDDRLIDAIRAGEAPGQQLTGLTPIKLAARKSD